jgi:hypothetical protein
MEVPGQTADRPKKLADVMAVVDVPLKEKGSKSK